jgi:hypothetical protein
MGLAGAAVKTPPDRTLLERVFRMLAFRCVRTLDEALSDPLRARLVYACATWLARRDRAEAEAAQRRRVVRPAESTPSPSRAWWQRPPTHITDLKRAAAGDRED